LTTKRARTRVLCLDSALVVFLLVAFWSTSTTNSSTLFYIAFTVTSLAIGFSVSRRFSSREVIFILLIAALVLRSIVPLSKPASIVDNFPDAYRVRRIVLGLIGDGVLHANAVGADFFTNYPGVSLLLASLQMVSGIDLSALLKYLPILLVLPVFGAVPVCVRAIGIRNRRSELTATAIVVLIPFLMEGTSHTSPHSFGTILLILGLAFFLDSAVGRKRRSAVCFVLVALSLVIYHVTSSLFLLAIASLFSLALAISQLGRRSQIRLGSSLILFILVAFLAWHAYVYSSSVPELFRSIVNVLSYDIRLSTASALPKGIKPPWMVMIEYCAFGSFGAAVLVSLFTKMNGQSLLPKLLTLVGIFLSSAFLGLWVLGGQSGTDLIPRSFLIVMITAAPLVGAKLGRNMNGLSKTFSQYLPHSQWGNYAAGAMITLLVLNSVYYSFPIYYYDSSVPLQTEDTRHNLENWQSLGSFVSLDMVPNQTVWSPRLGRGLVCEYSGVFRHCSEFVSQTENRVVMEASLFPYLPRIIRDEYVMISRSMLVAPDIPGYSPDIETPSRISTRVYDNGEIVLLIAFAPDTLVPYP